MLYAVFDWSWYWVKWERQMCLTRSMYSLAGGPSGLLTSCPSAAQAMWPMVSDHWSQRYWRWITSSSDGLQRSNWIIICNSWSTWWLPLKVNTVNIIFHHKIRSSAFFTRHHNPLRFSCQCCWIVHIVAITCLEWELLYEKGKMCWSLSPEVQQ